MKQDPIYIRKRNLLILIITFTLFWMKPSQANEKEKLPNIVIILEDDLGFGDVGCYNPESKIPTPNLDKLAFEGMRFTDAHTASTVCKPSRYGILMGRMPFRTGMKGVFTGVQGPSLIKENQLTLAQMLQEEGYETACFGKWHIGMTFYDKEGNVIKDRTLEGVKRVDYSRRIPDGPLDRGFDHFYGTVCCPTTDWLYAYVDGDRIPVPPTKLLDKEKLPNHPYSHDCRQGMVADNFNHEEVDLVFLQKSKEFLEKHVKANPEKPFFLYHAMQAVHLPSFPAEDFKGKTKFGLHGDFIFEMDYIVGELLKKLDELGVANNTLVMFASDNGPEVPTVIEMRKTHHHDGARPWRGMKRDDWEGGHRTPFIVKWPDKVKAGAVSNQLFSYTDIMATCAEIVNTKLPVNAAEDSYSFLSVFLGSQKDKPVRKYVLQQTNRLELSIRDGMWKYLDHKGSGGNDYNKIELAPYMIEDNDPEAPGQLYDLETDPGETNNLYSLYPEKVKEMKNQLDFYREYGQAPKRE